ncbi:aminoglycoside phosphotransferase [Caldalkalibacillus thermarum TA2.A1]|uniref:Phosphotransferase n=1 Tax=Caldalkalibacillus thermarum (strain TA2.A1) TaxID=986075 RepID=F5LAP6_CALTT|nr:phosphotransferase [Caldalkalibacillus thermarum]EGL81618.1 aminoglycoside phosphotransferase [Caldalkalibacillus thermarum TA2.A1]QZT33495.1 phosphotransferase [Caldalkalibacillus thermarum TA2.A1]
MNEAELKHFKQSFYEGYGKRIKTLDVIRPHHVYAAVTDADCFVVKFFRDANLLGWQHRCIQQLLDKETRGVVPFLPNKHRSVINEFEGRMYGVMPFIPGKSIDLNHSSHVQNSLRLLAYFHRQGGGIFGRQPAVPVQSKLYADWHERYVQFKHAFRDLPRGKNQDGLLQVVSRMAGETLEWAERTLDAFPQAYMLYLEEEAQWERQIAHLDIAPHNFLVIDDRYFYVIDYDRVAYAPPLVDVVQFFNMVLPSARWEYDAVKQLLSHYEHVFPVPKEQKRLVFLLLVFPHDVFRKWLGVWRREANFHPQQVYRYFQELEQNWDRRRTFVQRCLAMVK